MLRSAGQPRAAVTTYATLLLSTAQMRAAAIFGPGCSPKNLKLFQTDPGIEWRTDPPSSPDEADVVLVFGGDGTIHRHLHSLVTLGLPVLIVPVGSGNDFARALGLRTVRDSLKAWQRFCSEKNNVRAIDLGTIRPLESLAQATTYFCSIAGIGLNTEVTRRANALPRWLRGRGGYALSLVPALFRFAPLPIKIFTQNSDPANVLRSNGWMIRSDQPTMLAAFANTSSYGGGMKIAPDAKPDDGLLDACIIARVDPFKLACMFPTVYFGRHLGIREVKYFQAETMRVESEHPLDVYADGEFVCCTPLEISVQRKTLRVIIDPMVQP
ncbi:MAG TPA: diacylglycerol kinase family protein [Candidatus Sulfotelmatobacter sp.]